MKEGLLNELKKISKLRSSKVDDENMFYHQRSVRPSDTGTREGHRGPQGPGNSAQKANGGMAGNRGVEEELGAWKERVILEVRQNVQAENEKLKMEFAGVFQEVIKQVKLLGSSRKEEREEILGMQSDTDELMRIIKNLGGRFEKLENRFFSYEVEISTIKEDVSHRLTIDEKKSYSSYDKSIAPCQDDKRIDKLTEEIQSISSRQLNLDRHITTLDKALEKLDGKSKDNMKQAKEDLCTYVSESMTEIEMKISHLVHQALSDHSSTH